MSHSEGCGYQGHEFGGTYPDSVCIAGQLYDADSCDEEGRMFEPCEYLPCPSCNHEVWLTNQRDDIIEVGWLAAHDGDPRSICPFPSDKMKYPDDADRLRGWWQRGHDELSLGIAFGLSAAHTATRKEYNAIGGGREATPRLTTCLRELPRYRHRICADGDGHISDFPDDDPDGCYVLWSDIEALVAELGGDEQEQKEDGK